MKKLIKITSVLLCIALLLTLSVNASVENSVGQEQYIEVNQSTLSETDATNNVKEEQAALEVKSATTGATPIGHLDVVDSSIIGGWAYQSDIPNSALDVHVYITNISTGDVEFIPVTAGYYRWDLEEAGYGDGYHAFRYDIDWLPFKSGEYSVSAYAIGVDSCNPQLYDSPKFFTVREPEGNVEYVNSSGIGGWLWKPDAPNSEIDLHIYIYKLDGTQVEFYPVTAGQPRSDLEAAGYGNGEHGFSKSIDWSQFPEEELEIVIYAVDGSGYNPSFYVGYYDNRMPIYLIGMTDENGVDFSTWATQEVVNYAYNIGTPSVMICTGATKEGLLNVIRKSSFAVVSTHGTDTSIEYCMNPNTTSEVRGSLRWSDFLRMASDYFINTRCLLLNACSVGNETGNSAGNNMVKAFQSKGVQTVVGFVNEVYFLQNNGVVDNNWGSERWAKVFVRELGNGKTVQNAKNAAVNDAIDYFRDLEELDKVKQYEDALAEARSYGLVDVSIQGNPNQIVKH